MTHTAAPAPADTGDLALYPVPGAGSAETIGNRCVLRFIRVEPTRFSACAALSLRHSAKRWLRPGARPHCRPRLAGFRDICAREETWGFQRFATRANTCAVTLGD